MSSVERESPGKAYWRSLDELAETPEFQQHFENEFGQVLPDDAEVSDPVTRRRFLQLMGASLALGGLSGCKGSPVWPVRKVLPYAHRPENRVPGKPLHYASMLEIGGFARALLVKSQDGRPIKIEGNPDHPASRGAADAFSQASVLSCYDPDRSRDLVHREPSGEKRAPWADFFASMRPTMDGHIQQQGAGLAILSESTSSPTYSEIRARWAEKMGQAQWFEWETISRDNVRVATNALFGQPMRPQLMLAESDVIVSFDDDFLGRHPHSLAYGRAFAAKRRADGVSMTRLHAVECAYSNTGAMADHRHPLAHSEIVRAAWCLAAELSRRGLALPAGMTYLAEHLTRAPQAEGPFAFVGGIADDLLAHRGRAVITAGAQQPVAAHALAFVMTAMLEGFGKTLAFSGDLDAGRPTHAQSMADLITQLNGGRVQTLIILGGNPVYDAPSDLNFAEALKKAATTLHLSLFDNETSAACTWHLPAAHPLEAWADARTYDGTVTLGQPLIDPIFSGLTGCELLTSLLDGKQAQALGLVRRTWETRFAGTPTEDGWRRVVHDGFVAGSAWPLVTPDFSKSAWSVQETDLGAAQSGSELVFLEDASVYDGRFANLGWLQEFPDPSTKLTWDNAALVSPATAKEWGVRQGDLVEVASAGKSVRLPVFLQPGQAANTIGVALGYGRTKAGRIGNGIGFDVYPLRTTNSLAAALGVSVKKVAGSHKFATTQNHHAIFNEQQGRGQADRLPELFREGTIGEYSEHPEFAAHRAHTPELITLWKEPVDYSKGHRWGMSIDLTACNGCGACVIACQAENNIPIVGKDEVARGRELHWIRVDRYFTGDDVAPAMRHQPVTCHQCENAPCEQVCPVAATMHSAEGLNDMVYNRCVGTRYCSNNCPYKVRRFNYFNNQTGSLELRKKRPEGITTLESMVYNPEVTVRARGVMEKCTYCVQRIKAVTIPAKNEGRIVKDGEIVPACAQTCPTEAIVFGDLNDPESRVRKLQDHPRSYAMLAELNVLPRTKYMAKLTNPTGDTGGHGAGHGETPAAPSHGESSSHGSHQG